MTPVVRRGLPWAAVAAGLLAQAAGVEAPLGAELPG